jgi:3-phosphoshikimate 1-carboxyvinyltransferase
MEWRVSPSHISGETEVAGDKGIAHRALMLASIANGRSEIGNFPSGEAVEATAGCLRSLGVTINKSEGTAVVESPGALAQPRSELYAGNSGTTMRLLTGILAAQSFSCTFTGDPFLSTRPMSRIVEPLSRMGASVRSTGGRPPLEIKGRPLTGIHYTLPVASAQVKSCVLFAALLAEGETVVAEPVLTRDHTERLLEALNLVIERQNGLIRLIGPQQPRPFALHLPGDPSSAAFLLTAAALTNGRVFVKNVGVNPSRVSFLDVLRHMGSRVEVLPRPDHMGEPVGDITVSGRPKDPIELHGSHIPSLIDELPLIVLLASQVTGTSIIHGAEELRVKESDRISGVVQILQRMGADIDELPDGFAIRGPAKLSGARVKSQGDHRLAMMAAIAGAIATSETVICGAEAAAVSFPQFVSHFRALGGRIDVN